MNHSDFNDDLLKIEEQLRSLKPAKTPADLTQKLVQIVKAPRQAPRRSAQRWQRWLPLAAAAALILCLGGLFQWAPHPEKTLESSPLTLPSLAQFKDQSKGMIELSKTFVDAYTEQAPTLSLFKSISKEDLLQFAARLDQATERAKLNPQRLKQGTDVALGILSSGTPTLATLAVAKPSLIEMTKKEK